jgi:peptidoglycan/LPS O-acetylase OafA/YrhL
VGNVGDSREQVRQVTDAARRAPGRAVHIYPVDMVRVLTFACVIAAHTISTVNPLDSVLWGGAAMLLHFTREAFFVLTAFVLTSRYRDSPPKAVPFWRRRFLLVGVPYLVWSLVYSTIEFVSFPRSSTRETVISLLYNLGTGQAWFHLYFLLVSLQFYLLFPLFARLLRATKGHHVALVVASAAGQVLLDLWMHDPAPQGAKAWYLHFASSYVISYQFFMVLGGVVAMHRDRVDAWLRSNPRLIIAALIVTGMLAEGQYIWKIAHGGNAIYDTDVFQVVIIPWSVAVVAGFYAIGTAWSARRDAGPKSRFVERASDRSFGVFLAHPLILWALTAAGPSSPASHLPAPLSSVAVYLVAVTGSLAFVELVRRTPLSLTLTGKRRVKPHPMRAVPEHSVEQLVPDRSAGARS